ncbi:hypothetical protein C1H46_008339 [Malus baccata]|uniref:Uncharacterized protein n=1 Tax=Malus baccata TaxID=106549 RepID=A0A540N4T7_MALBA|nr:hypothetical protein C1H46_008339 [Malus baccata]
MEIEPIEDKRIRRIHKALGSDDVELVGFLLKESDIALDDAYAFHYSVAYCDRSRSRRLSTMLLLAVAYCIILKAIKTITLGEILNSTHSHLDRECFESIP